MGEGESLIGGFAGGLLSRGLHIGYGIYFTTRRLIGIDLGKNGGGAIGGTMGGFIQGELMPKLSQEQSERIIAQLNQMKDFDVEKNQIGRLEIYKPGMLGTGQIVIRTANGDSIKITLRNKIAYDRLISLAQAFGPELVGHT